MTQVGPTPVSPVVVAGRYQLGQTLGRGGMADVHAGTDLRLGREVAVKVMRADLARDPVFRARFEREAQHVAAMNHPGIVAVYDTGELTSPDGVGLPYIVMEYVSGSTLRDLVRVHGPMSPERACGVMAEVCAALDYSHQNGLVHRDVKPANILISDEGSSGFARTVKLTDFGVAHFVDGSRLTNDGTIIGTAAYLSPEQVAGEPIGFATDVYSLGLVLLEALTGKQEYSGTLIEAALARLRHDPEIPDDIAPEWRDLLAKMTARNPDRRPTAVAIANALRGGSTQITGPVPLGPQRVKHKRDHRLHRAAHRHAKRGTFVTVRRWRRRNVLVGSFAAFGVLVACAASYVAGALH